MCSKSEFKESTEIENADSGKTRMEADSIAYEFFTIRSHLHFKPEFTSRGLKNFGKKLPPSTGN